MKTIQLVSSKEQKLLTEHLVEVLDQFDLHAIKVQMIEELYAASIWLIDILKRDRRWRGKIIKNDNGDEGFRVAKREQMGPNRLGLFLMHESPVHDFLVECLVFTPKRIERWYRIRTTDSRGDPTSTEPTRTKRTDTGWLFECGWETLKANPDSLKGAFSPDEVCAELRSLLEEIGFISTIKKRPA